MWYYWIYSKVTPKLLLWINYVPDIEKRFGWHEGNFVFDAVFLRAAVPGACHIWLTTSFFFAVTSNLSPYISLPLPHSTQFLDAFCLRGCRPDSLSGKTALIGSGERISEPKWKWTVDFVCGNVRIRLCCGVNMGPGGMGGSVGLGFRICNKICKNFSLWFVGGGELFRNIWKTECNGETPIFNGCNSWEFPRRKTIYLVCTKHS